MIVVSDTSPLSSLIQIDRLHLLSSVFGQVLIPPFVHEEIVRLEQFQVDLAAYHRAEWLKVVEIDDDDYISELVQSLDRGEAEAIALAKQCNADLLLIDERIGTRKAKEHGVSTVGLIGVLIKAKEKGYIEELKSLLDQLEVVAGFYIGNKLRERVLTLVGE